MIRRPPRSTQSRSSAASDVYKRQVEEPVELERSHVGYDYLHLRETLHDGLEVVGADVPVRSRRGAGVDSEDPPVLHDRSIDPRHAFIRGIKIAHQRLQLDAEEAAL